MVAVWPLVLCCFLLCQVSVLVAGGALRRFLDWLSDWQPNHSCVSHSSSTQSARHVPQNLAVSLREQQGGVCGWEVFEKMPFSSFLLSWLTSDVPHTTTGICILLRTFRHTHVPFIIVKLSNGPLPTYPTSPLTEERLFDTKYTGSMIFFFWTFFSL